MAKYQKQCDYYQEGVLLLKSRERLESQIQKYIEGGIELRVIPQERKGSLEEAVDSARDRLRKIARRCIENRKYHQAQRILAMLDGGIQTRSGGGILSRDVKPLFQNKFPRAEYEGVNSFPELLAKVLRYRNENYDLYGRKRPVTWKELGRAAGISYSYMLQIKKGKIKRGGEVPAEGVIIRLAAALNADIDLFLKVAGKK